MHSNIIGIDSLYFISLPELHSLTMEPSVTAEIKPPSDFELMAQVKSGCDNAFRLLVDRWQRPLLNFFYRSTASAALAEDLAQITFIKLYRAAPRYEPNAKFSTYLFCIARRVLLNEYRQQSRKPLNIIDPDTLPEIAECNSKANMREIEEAFLHALRELPENHRTAILLLKQQELGYDAIAEAMEATESAVKSWIHRARKKLKTSLKNVL